MATNNNKNRSWTCPHSLLSHAHTHTRTHVCVSVVALLISCVARLLGWGLFSPSFSLSLSLCSVITSVAEQETVNARSLFTSLSLTPAVAGYPWFVVSFPFADNKENSQCVFACVSVHLCAYWFNNAHDWQFIYVNLIMYIMQTWKSSGGNHLNSTRSDLLLIHVLHKWFNHHVVK